MAGWTKGPIECRRSAEMRYGEQVYEIDVPLDEVDFDSPSLPGDLKRVFEARHEELYTYALADQDPVLINARVTTVGVLPSPPTEPEAPVGEPPAPSGTRRIYLGEWQEAPVYAFDSLSSVRSSRGPRSSSRTPRPCSSGRATKQRPPPNAGSTSASSNDARFRDEKKRPADIFFGSLRRRVTSRASRTDV